VLSVSTVDLSYRHRRRGSGEPLLLIHGTGSNLRAWAPVFGLPASRRDVIAVDLPGHGDSPLAPAGTPSTAANFARLISTRLP
jgi:pimeloyl-ACP methyl ester carboxylesterase